MVGTSVGSLESAVRRLSATEFIIDAGAREPSKRFMVETRRPGSMSSVRASSPMLAALCMMPCSLISLFLRGSMA